MENLSDILQHYKALEDLSECMDKLNILLSGEQYQFSEKLTSKIAESLHVVYDAYQQAGIDMPEEFWEDSKDV